MEVTTVVEKYIKLRDLKTKLDKEHKERIAPIEGAMEKAEAALLAFFNESGMDSAGCAAGTAYRSSKVSVTVTDMDAFLEFVKANEAWHMLERRASKVAVDEYAADTNDLPPGINRTSMASINIRRAS